MTHKGKDGYRYRGLFNAKRADFVICSPSFKTVCVVEPDDSLHRAEKDRQRDELLKAAGIPLLRYESKSKPSVEEIRAGFSAFCSEIKTPDNPTGAEILPLKTGKEGNPWA